LKNSKKKKIRPVYSFSELRKNRGKDNKTQTPPLEEPVKGDKKSEKPDSEK
tara:strand:+ start:13885 stop:14037 length:153 start_codon:yes stop_codon:yes gene_type:complete